MPEDFSCPKRTCGHSLALHDAGATQDGAVMICKVCMANGAEAVCSHQP